MQDLTKDDLESAETTWWLPKPLARILPRADFEAGSAEQVPARA
jgi:hypothetical protein